VGCLSASLYLGLQVPSAPRPVVAHGPLTHHRAHVQRQIAIRPEPPQNDNPAMLSPALDAADEAAAEVRGAEPAGALCRTGARSGSA
jgi:hypothetical protein